MSTTPGEPDTFFCYARERILTYHLCKERPQRPDGDRLVSDVQEIENGEAIAIRLEAIAIGLESGLLFEHHMHRDTRRAETWLCGS